MLHRDPGLVAAAGGVCGEASKVHCCRPRPDIDLIDPRGVPA
jgi:hypothetical protein